MKRLILIISLCSFMLTNCEKDDNDVKSEWGTVTDIGGNVYKTVKIGDQWWMAENLKTTKYNDDTEIPLVTDNTAWSNLTIPGYCWQGNTARFRNMYGALYNWYVADIVSNDGKNVCPTGWHVPADAEWTTLTTYLGGENVAGGKLKAKGILDNYDSNSNGLWLEPNTGATNETGFTALPSGGRYTDGTTGFTTVYAFWWSATELDTIDAFYRRINYNGSNVGRYNGSKRNGFSIRCVKD